MTTTAQERQTWIPPLTFGARLALVRQRMGWNIKQAAIECGLPPGSWRGWELTGHLPQNVFQKARKISQRTGVEYDWLIEGAELSAALGAEQAQERGASARPNKRCAAGPPNRSSGERSRPMTPRLKGGPRLPAAHSVIRTRRSDHPSFDLHPVAVV